MNAREKAAKKRLAELAQRQLGQGRDIYEDHHDHENYKAGPIARLLGSKGKRTR